MMRERKCLNAYPKTNHWLVTLKGIKQLNYVNGLLRLLNQLRNGKTSMTKLWLPNSMPFALPLG
jgi:hypothetical protein